MSLLSNISPAMSAYIFPEKGGSADQVISGIGKSKTHASIRETLQSPHFLMWFR